MPKRKVNPMTDREALRLREQRVIELEELLSHARMESANLRNEIKLLENTNATLRFRLERRVLSENRPEDRSGLGRPFHHVPGGWDIVRGGDMGDTVIKPKPPAEPVVIEAHGLRIKVEKL